MPAASRVALRPAAVADLKSILRHIAEDSPESARRIRLGFEERFGKLPRLGDRLRLRTELAPGLRGVRYKSWLIFYQALETQIIIVRILHESRDLGALLAKPET